MGVNGFAPAAEQDYLFLLKHIPANFSVSTGAFERVFFTIHRFSEYRGLQESGKKNRFIYHAEIERAVYHFRRDKDNSRFINQVFFHLFTEEQVYLRIKTAKKVGGVVPQEDKIFVSVMGMRLSLQLNRLDKELPAHVDVSAGDLVRAPEISLGPGDKR